MHTPTKYCPVPKEIVRWGCILKVHTSIFVFTFPFEGRLLIYSAVFQSQATGHLPGAFSLMSSFTKEKFPSSGVKGSDFHI